MTTTKLAKDLPCTLFNIRFPIWNNGQRVVGLAVNRLTKHNEVRILYTRKTDGMRTYPDNYYVNGDIARVFFPRMTVKGNVELALIPVDQLQIIERV